jgi:hypothetical protein
MCFSSFSLTLALDEVEWSTPCPGRFTTGKQTQNPLHRRLGMDVSVTPQHILTEI